MYVPTKRSRVTGAAVAILEHVYTEVNNTRMLHRHSPANIT